MAAIRPNLRWTPGPLRSAATKRMFDDVERFQELEAWDGIERVLVEDRAADPRPTGRTATANVTTGSQD
jgi:hypothetical protein